MKSYPNLYLRGRVYQYEFERLGKRFRGSTNTHLVREAQAIVRQKIDEAEAGGTPVTERKRDAPKLSILELEAWDVDRAVLAASHDEKHQTIHSIWKRIARYFETVADVSDDSITAYARKMSGEGYSTATIKRDLWALRRAYAWAAPAANLPALGPIPHLAASPLGDKKGRYLEPDELGRWLQHLKGQALAHAVVALATGIRAKELVRFEPSWLSQDTITLPAHATKGRKQRQLPLSASLAALVRGCGTFRVDPRCAWRTASKRADVELISMRDLRHTFITTLAPFDPDGTRLVAGHTSGDKNAHMYYQHASKERLRAVAVNVHRAFPALEYHAKRALGQLPNTP